MRGFYVAFALSMLVVGTSQVAGMERAPPKRNVQSIAAVQAKSSDPVTPIRKAGFKRQLSATPDFRAEELIPDICKGCSF